MPARTVPFQRRPASALHECCGTRDLVHVDVNGSDFQATHDLHERGEVWARIVGVDRSLGLPLLVEVDGTWCIRVEPKPIFDVSVFRSCGGEEWREVFERRWNVVGIELHGAGDDDHGGIVDAAGPGVVRHRVPCLLGEG